MNASSVSTIDTTAAPTLQIRGLSKSFGSNQVLSDVDLDIEGGEFVGLMGPNGAGKSTLIKILDGVYSATRGEIRLGDDVVTALGDRPDVGFIHQDLGLVDELTILGNLRLGVTPLRLAGPILNRRAERAAAERALERIGLDQSVDTLVGELAPGEKTLVAIARVFDRGAKLVFVDESTSTLPPSDARRVIDSLRTMAAEGATIVMVTHKLSEILDATQRVVVLLDGRVATDEPTAGLDRAALVRMLFQHEAATGEDGEGPGDRQAAPGETLLELRDVYAGRAGPVDLTIEAGTVIGVTGLPGSGLHDVAYVAHGSMKPHHGTVQVARKGLRRSLVPPHRESQGGFGELEVRQNLTISAMRRWTKAIRLLAVGREARDSEEIVQRLSVTPGRIDAGFGVLSGGNKQKVIFGRALLNEPEVYVLCEPTRGVDVGTRSEIYRLIRELRAQGAGILIVSSDAEDLFAVCDRLGVIEDGRLSGLKPIGEMQMAQLERMV